MAGPSIGDLIMRVVADLKGFSAQITKEADTAGDKAGKQLTKSMKKSTTSTMSSLKGGLLQGLGLGAGLGVAQGVAAAVGTIEGAFAGGIERAQQFDEALRNVSSISHFTEAQLKDTGDQIIKLSNEFGKSAVDLANGLYDISSSGFQGAEAMKILRAATSAAAAGLTDAKVAAGGITAVLNAYHRPADDAAKVSDVLFQTVNDGVITFEELAANIGKTTALSAPLGISLEDVAAAAATLTKNGIDAENTFTQINAVMTSLLQPSAQAAKLADDLGLQWNVAELKARGLVGTMQDLIKATGGNQEEMATLLGDARAIRGAFVLAANGGKDFNQELKNMTDAAGATGAALGEQEKGAAYQMRIMNTEIDNAFMQIGQSLIPVLRDFALGVTHYLLPALGSLGDDLRTLLSPLASFADGVKIILGNAGDLAGGLNDLAGGVGDLINPVDHAGLALGVAADHADALRSVAGPTATGLRDIGREADASIIPIQKSGAATKESGHQAKIATVSYQDFVDALINTARQLIDDYFNPLETRFAALEAHRQLIADKEALRTAKTSTDIHNATNSIIGDLDDQAGALVDLAEQGNITKKDVDKFRDDTVAAYKAMGKKVPADIQKVIDKLYTLTNFNGGSIHVTAKVVGGVVQDYSTGHGGPKAEGGPVRPGIAYQWQERGREMFIPSTAGYVANAAQTAALAGMDGGSTGNTTVHLTVPAAAAAQKPTDVAREVRIAASQGWFKPRRR